MVFTTAQTKDARRARRSFTDEFKAGAVRLVLDQGSTVADVARSRDLTLSGLSGWVEHARGRPEPGRAARARELGDRVDAIFGRSRRTYGSPRILAELRAEGTRVGRNQVIAAMRDKGLVARSRRRFRATTMSDHEQPVADNVLDRQIDALAPNVTWVADTTELLIGQSGQRGFLASVVDLYSRYVLGWALSAVNDRHLTIYNQRRRHSVLGYVGPAEFERSTVMVAAASRNRLGNRIKSTHTGSGVPTLDDAGQNVRQRTGASFAVDG